VRWPRGAASCSAASRPRRSRSRPTNAGRPAAGAGAGQLHDAAAQAGLQTALALKLEREQALAATRSEYDDLSAKLRRRRAAPGHERSLDPLREQITKLQLEEQAAQLGGAQYLEQLTPPGRPRGAGAGDRGGRRQALGPADRDRPHQSDIAALGAVNLAALDELTAARERKTFLDAQNADLLEAINAGRRHPQDRPRDARPAGADLQPGQRTFRPHVPEPVRRRQRASW
jgi:hypothetical protein